MTGSLLPPREDRKHREKGFRQVSLLPETKTQAAALFLAFSRSRSPSRTSGST